MSKGHLPPFSQQAADSFDMPFYLKDEHALNMAIKTRSPLSLAGLRAPVKVFLNYCIRELCEKGFEDWRNLEHLESVVLMAQALAGDASTINEHLVRNDVIDKCATNPGGVLEGDAFFGEVSTAMVAAAHATPVSCKDGKLVLPARECIAANCEHDTYREALKVIPESFLFSMYMWLDKEGEKRKGAAALPENWSCALQGYACAREKYETSRALWRKARLRSERAEGIAEEDIKPHAKKRHTAAPHAQQDSLTPLVSSPGPGNDHGDNFQKMLQRPLPEEVRQAIVSRFRETRIHLESMIFGFHRARRWLENTYTQNSAEDRVRVFIAQSLAVMNDIDVLCDEEKNDKRKRLYNRAWHDFGTLIDSDKMRRLPICFRWDMGLWWLDARLEMMYSNKEEWGTDEQQYFRLLSWVSSTLVQSHADENREVDDNNHRRLSSAAVCEWWTSAMRQYSFSSNGWGSFMVHAISRAGETNGNGDGGDSKGKSNKKRPHASWVFPEKQEKREQVVDPRRYLLSGAHADVPINTKAWLVEHGVNPGLPVYRRRPGSVPSEVWDEVAQKHPNFKHVVDYYRLQGHLSHLTGVWPHTPPVLLVGPPGCGKTAFARSVATAMRTHLETIDMSQVTTSFVLTGSNSTWSTGSPGRVVSALLQHETTPVFFLDEIDKSHYDTHNIGGSPVLSMLGLLEPSSAASFTDEYLQGWPVDARHPLWILSANDEYILPSALRSRARIFRIARPTENQLPGIIRSMYEQWRSHDHEMNWLFSDALPHMTLKAMVRESSKNTDLRPLQRLLEDSAARAAARIVAADVAQGDATDKPSQKQKSGTSAAAQKIVIEPEDVSRHALDAPERRSVDGSEVVSIVGALRGKDIAEE